MSPPLPTDVLRALARATLYLRMARFASPQPHPPVSVDDVFKCMKTLLLPVLQRLPEMHPGHAHAVADRRGLVATFSVQMRAGRAALVLNYGDLCLDFYPPQLKEAL